MDAPFYIERAKGGRANCKDCKQPCTSGELRISKVVTGPYGDGKPMKMWYHIPCMMKILMKQRPSTRRITSIADVENFSNLSPDDKKTFLQSLNDMEKDYARKNNLEIKCIEEIYQNDDNVIVEEQQAISNILKYDVNHSDNKFKTFHDLCKSIAGHDKYLDKTAIVKTMFTKGTDNSGFKGDFGLWCRFLLPGSIKRVYNLKNKQLIKLFSRIFKLNQDDMLTDMEQGNIGETVKKFYKMSSIYSAQVSTLNLFEIDEFLNNLSALTREEEQVQHFKTIINKLSADDLKYLIYLINGDLRMNAGPKHILGALHADAYKLFQASKDIDILISRVMSADVNKLNMSPTKGSVEAAIILMKPVLPMLAEACKSVEMAMEKCKNGMISEIKYDGERVQVHKQGNEFRYFSRALKPVVEHKIARFKDYIPKAFPHAKDLILDSEILMVDTKTGQPLPFGSLGVHKKQAFKDAEVCLFVFDCIFYNGEDLTNVPMIERRKILEENMTEIKNHVMFSELKVIHHEKDLTRMIMRVLKEGLEGLVLKDLKSIYEPGKRHWLKMKKDYLFDGAMADCADLVVVGASYGTGKKGGMLSVFLMGCYDETKKKWLTVTKVHTGFDDNSLASIQDELLSKMTKISQDIKKVPSWLSCTKAVVPDFVANDPTKQPVWEIMGTEFTKANIHTADGISIRFPRINKIRNDKSWRTATSLKELKNLFITSKQNIDTSLFKKYEESDEEEKQSVPVVPSSSKSIAPVKRKNTEDKGNEPKILALKPVKPFPNIFTDCIILFYSEEPDLLSDTRVNDLKRYIRAFNGFEDHTKDGSAATHVIHLTKDISYKSLNESKYDFSKKARHVNINWLKKCVKTKELLDTRPYSVTLLN